jgi:radical SAM superfamily enzyme YgiQ (UPF0313 family)
MKGLSSIKYNEPLFRPPAEANSAIIQATIGCSWNKCAFCEMYTSKTFRIKKFTDLQTDIALLAKYYQGVKKIFLADGNAFVLSANHLIPILQEINSKFGKLQRISSYALPKDIASKTVTELKEIRDLGLKLLYVGIESGDDELLKRIHKSETFNSSVDGLLKAQEAGIDVSIMVLNGLGGKTYSEQHAMNTAKLINQTSPKFLSSLTLSFPFGQDHYKKKFEGVYIPQTIVELAKELKLFIGQLEIQNSIFRSDHVSNNLVLKGILSRDKEELINLIDHAIDSIDEKLYPRTPSML